jgi:uncharacterized membrane protein YgcG
MNRLAKTGHKGFPKALRGCVLAALLLGLAGTSLAQSNEAAAKPMVLPWITDVVKMSAAGVPQDVIQVYVKNSHTRSTLTPDDIIYLRDGGVATGIVNTMIEHGASQPAAVAAAAPPVAQPQYAPQPPAYAPAPQYYQQPADYSDQPSSSVYYVASSPPSYPYYSGYPYYYTSPYWYYYPSIYYTGSRYCYTGSRYCYYPRAGFTAGFHGNSGSAVRVSSSMGGHSVGAVSFSGGGGSHGGGGGRR